MGSDKGLCDEYTGKCQCKSGFSGDKCEICPDGSKTLLDGCPNSKYRISANSFRKPKIQQTKMLVTCQRFGDWFLFGLFLPYSSNQKNIMKVGSKSLLLTCSSNKL